MHQLDINNEITKNKHCIEDIRHLFTSALIDLYNRSGRRDVSLIQKRSGTLRSSASQQDITAFQV